MPPSGDSTRAPVRIGPVPRLQRCGRRSGRQREVDGGGRHGSAGDRHDGVPGDEVVLHPAPDLGRRDPRDGSGTGTRSPRPGGTETRGVHGRDHLVGAEGVLAGDDPALALDGLLRHVEHGPDGSGETTHQVQASSVVVVTTSNTVIRSWVTALCGAAIGSAARTTRCSTRCATPASNTGSSHVPAPNTSRAVTGPMVGAWTIGTGWVCSGTRHAGTHPTARPLPSPGERSGSGQGAVRSR